MNIKELFEQLTKKDKEQIEQMLDEEIDKAHKDKEQIKNEAWNESIEKMRLARKKQHKAQNVRASLKRQSKISPARQLRLRKLGKL